MKPNELTVNVSAHVDPNLTRILEIMNETVKLQKELFELIRNSITVQATVPGEPDDSTGIGWPE